MISSLGHRLIFLACSLLIAFSTNAGAVLGPELSVRTARGKMAKLAIEEIKADISFLADIAETNLTITFRNTEERMLEGEFALPLPEGATVSSYALDVNGAMREAVVVEKERARFAYESIKRQMIDPGYVEREAGNIYRTKIFPILSKSTKAVRIGYREHLRSTKGQLSYRLPLTLSRSAEKTRFTITQKDRQRVIIQNSAGLPFRKVDQKSWIAHSTKHVFDQDLILTFPTPERPRLLTTEKFFYLYHPHPPSPEIKNAAPSRIHLIWDCSFSGRLRDHEKEFTFLDYYFERLRNTTVDLSLLHFTQEESGTFEIKNGDWSSLKKRLEEIHYNGATNLSILRTKDAPTMLFTEGQSHFSPHLITWPDGVTLIDSLGTCSTAWKYHSRRYLDLSVSTASHAHSFMQTPIPEIENFGDMKASKFMVTPPSSHDPSLRLFGEIESLTSSSPILTFKGTSARDQLTIEKISSPESSAIIETVWAQKKLQFLEARKTSHEQIVSHCQSHSLVSDYTSLIVLDRFKDYLRYRIPPPEEDLRKRYETELAKKSDTPFRKIEQALNSRKWWHQKAFPWHEHQLIGKLSHVHQWLSAVKQTFEPSEISQLSHEAIREWKNATTKAIEKRKHLKTQSQFESWRRTIQDLAKTQHFITPPPTGNLVEKKSITVSVRGLVNTEGKVKGPKDFTLKQALSKAGGFIFQNQLHTIALYRDASKTLYNIYSKEFTDIPLLSGDMIVAEAQPSSDHDGRDPFSDTPSPPTDPRNEPAIIPQSKRAPFLDSDPFADDGGSSKPTKIGRTHSLVIQDSPSDERLQKFKQELIEGQDPHLAYAKLTQNKRFTASFYHQISDILRQHSQPELARRVLSNLIETENAGITNYRKFAFILALQKDWQTAFSVLQSIARAFPNEQALKLDLAWILQHQNAEQTESKEEIEKHWFAIANDDQTQSRNSLAEIITADLVASPTARKRLPLAFQNQQLDLDLRIVVTSASTEIPNLKITEPTGTILPEFRWTKTSLCGGRCLQNLGVTEYAIKDAIPGIYDFSCITREDQVFRIQIYQNWGRPEQHYEERIVIVSKSKDSQGILRHEIRLPEN